MIDWTRVQTLKDELGAEDFVEVVGMFLAEVEEVIARLRTNVNHDNLEADLHFLKSSALNLGFSNFSELCGSGEVAAAAGKQVDVARILAAYAESRDAFKRTAD